MSSENLIEARQALWSHLDEVRSRLLGVEGSGQHMQPMTHHADPDHDTLWFITSSRSDLVRAVGTGARAQFTITGHDHDYWASLSGAIVQSEDEVKLDALWSAVSSAWFHDGRADSDICLLKLSLSSASVWTATGNPLTFGLEILRANVSEDHRPQVGEHWVLDLGVS